MREAKVLNTHAVKGSLGHVVPQTYSVLLTRNSCFANLHNPAESHPTLMCSYDHFIIIIIVVVVLLQDVEHERRSNTEYICDRCEY